MEFLEEEIKNKGNFENKYEKKENYEDLNIIVIEQTEKEKKFLYF